MANIHINLIFKVCFIKNYCKDGYEKFMISD